LTRFQNEVFRKRVKPFFLWGRRQSNKARRLATTCVDESGLPSKQINNFPD
jgi:hypothetical protein